MLASQSTETEEVIKDCTLAQSSVHVLCVTAALGTGTQHIQHT